MHFWFFGKTNYSALSNLEYRDHFMYKNSFATLYFIYTLTLSTVTSNVLVALRESENQGYKSLASAYYLRQVLVAHKM